MKLSDFKGEEAIDVLAEITEPLANILCDKEIKELAEKKAIPAKYVKPALKNHKEDVIYILAVLNRKTVEDFKEELNLLNLPIMLIELINDEQVQNLFARRVRWI